MSTTRHSSAVGWLLPAPPTQPYAPLRAGAGGAASTCEAMRADGLLVRVLGDVYLPADAVASVQARAAALALVVPARAVVALSTAAWLLGAPVASEPVEVAVPPGTGSRTGRSRLVVEHRIALAAEHVEVCDGVRVTTPARTAADLSRCPDDARAHAALTWLMARGVREGQVLSVLRTANRVPHARAARATLRSLRSLRGDPLRGAAPSGQPVDVEDAVHPADSGKHVPEVRGVAHLERELGDGDAVA